jgi:hypothetical protein
VVVDDPGSNHQAIRIQHLARVSIHFADLDDTTAADGDIAVKAWQAGPVNHLAVLDYQVVWHCSSYVAPNFAGVDIAILCRKYSLTRLLST